MKVKKIRVSLTLTPVYVEGLDTLVQQGLFIDRQDAIRMALRDLFQKQGLDPFRDMSQKTDLPSP